MIPPRGGDTLWCDLVDAYVSLSAPLRAMLDGLVAVHSTANTFARFQNDDNGGQNMQKIAQHAPVRHPVVGCCYGLRAADAPQVRVVPETGAKALFVNPTFTNHIEGFSLEESKAVLELLYKVASLAAAPFRNARQVQTEPERTVRWHWRAGDVAMWDNRATAHYAAASAVRCCTRRCDSAQGLH